MSFFKKIFNKAKIPKVEPLNDGIKSKIKNSTTTVVDGYAEKYKELIPVIKEEWDDEDKKYENDDVKKEAHDRAGLDQVKDDASDTIWNEIEPDVEKQIKTQTTNDIAIKGGKKAGEKAVKIMINKLIDEGVEETTKKFMDE